MQKTLKIVRANKREFGGAEIYLERLCHELNALGISYQLVHSLFPKWILSSLRAFLFNKQICCSKTNNDFLFSLDRISCADILRVGDGVHKHYMYLKKSSPLKPLNIVYNSIEKKAFMHAKHLIAISQMVKQNIIEHYSVPPEKITVIYNGIPHKAYNKKESLHKLQKEFPLNNKPIFLYVGSGYKRKGVFELLNLFSQIPQESQLFIVGKEKHQKKYENFAKSLGIYHKTFFAGARKDVSDFYAIADIFIFPTHYEPFGNVILEAMHAKCAVITTKQCGGGEIIEPKWLMKNPFDTTIITKISSLLNNAEQLQAVQEWNYQRSLEFSMQKNTMETLAILKNFL